MVLMLDYKAINGTNSTGTILYHTTSKPLTSLESIPPKPELEEGQHQKQSNEPLTASRVP